MWRLWHKIFGWHYASVSFASDYYICRVHTDGDGRAYVRLFDCHFDLQWCGDSHPWFPLTFPREAVLASKPDCDVIVMPRKSVA